MAMPFWWIDPFYYYEIFFIIFGNTLEIDPLLGEVFVMETSPVLKYWLLKWKKHQYSELQMYVGEIGKKGSEDAL